MDGRVYDGSRLTSSVWTSGSHGIVTISPLHPAPGMNWIAILSPDELGLVAVPTYVQTTQRNVLDRTHSEVITVLTGNEIADRTESLVHADTQLTDHGLDLTVDAIHTLTGAGRLDFGGSEFEKAPREELPPELASPDDDYGWWRLDAGTYLAVYNERVRLRAGEVARIDSLARLQMAGASHASWSFTGSPDELSSLLFVSSAGCHLKENCRISRLSVTTTGWRPEPDR